MKPYSILALLFFPFVTAAQLTVTAAPPKIAGSKAVVPLAMKNNLPTKIESARAVVFLLDEQGKMVGQATHWVIGGVKENPPLEPDKEAKFNFVVTADKPLVTTNLIVKVSFTQLILASGKAVDLSKDVQIQK